MKLKYRTRRALAGYAFISPFIVGFLCLFAYAVVMAIVYSFNKIVITPTGYELQGVGWKYYLDALTVHTWYNRTLVTSVTNMLTNVPMILIFSFFISCLLNQKFKGRTAARAIFFLPVILSAGVIVKIDNMDLVNSAVLHGTAQEGTMASQVSGMFDISGALMGFGFPTQVVTFIQTTISNIYGIITDSGVQILVFLAALQSIPSSLYEASSIEGATAWENFWKITFPMLSPYILTNVVYSIVDYFSSYKNGVISVIMYTAQSGEKDLSYSMAMAVIYFAVVSVILAIVIGFLSRLVYYEDKR